MDLFSRDPWNCSGTDFLETLLCVGGPLLCPLWGPQFCTTWPPSAGSEALANHHRLDQSQTPRGVRRNRGPARTPSLGRVLPVCKASDGSCHVPRAESFLRPDPVLGAGCAARPRCAGALPSSKSCVSPLLEGLKPISLSFQDGLQSGQSTVPAAVPQYRQVLYEEEPLCGSEVALYQKDACTLRVSPFDVNLGP